MSSQESPSKEGGACIGYHPRYSNSESSIKFKDRKDRENMSRCCKGCGSCKCHCA